MRVTQPPSTRWEAIQGKPSAFPPFPHASTHASGGTDPVTPSSIGAASSAEVQLQSAAISLRAILAAERPAAFKRLRAWGMNGSGQLGDNTTINRLTPVDVLGAGGTGFLSNVIAITAGGQHSLACLGDGTVWAWGYNANGQLGDNTTTNRLVPVQVKGPGGSGVLSNIIAIAAGGNHSLALRADGTVWAWGLNTYGQLGDNTTTNRLTPVQVLGPGGSGVLSNIIAIAAGPYFSLALSYDGTVWAWGFNGNGQLGDNTTTNRLVPVQVKGPGGSGVLSNIIAIAAGASYSIALSADGTVWAWGGNRSGELGDNTTTGRLTPAQVLGPDGSGVLSNIIAIDAGFSHSLGLAADGTIWAWGYNAYGQIGDNTTTNRLTPVHVLDPSGSGALANIVAVAAGAFHSLALHADGTVWAWGYNVSGQLGDSTTTNRLTPVQVLGPGGSGVLRKVIEIAASGDHSLARYAA